MAGFPRPWKGVLSAASARICRSGAWLFATLIASAFLPFAQMPWLWIPVIAVSLGLTWMIFRDVREMWFRGALDPDAPEDGPVEVVDVGRSAPRAIAVEEDPEDGFRKLEFADLDLEDRDTDYRDAVVRSTVGRSTIDRSTVDRNTVDRAAADSAAVDSAAVDSAAVDRDAFARPSRGDRQLDFEVPVIPARGRPATPAIAPTARPRPREEPARLPSRPEPTARPTPARAEPAASPRTPGTPTPRATEPSSPHKPDPAAVPPIALDGAVLAIEILALRGGQLELAVAADDGRSAGHSRITADLEAALRFGDALRGFPAHAEDRRDATLGRIDPNDPTGALRLVLFQTATDARVFATIWPDAAATDPAARQVASIAVQTDADALRAFVDALAGAVLTPGARVVLGG